MKKINCSTLQAELQALGYRLLNRLNPFRFTALAELAAQMEEHGKLMLSDFACWRARNLLIEVLRALDSIGWDTLYTEWQTIEVTRWSLLGSGSKERVHAPLRRDTLVDLIAACPC